MPRVAVPVLVESERVVVEQTKHAQRLSEKRLNALEYDQVLALHQVQAARLNCHIRYSTDIDDGHHDDHVQVALDAACAYANADHVQLKFEQRVSLEKGVIMHA